METLAEIDAIYKAWEKHILNLKPSRNLNEEEFVRDYFYAGGWRPCRRRMVLEATHPNYFPEYDVNTKARFLRGEQREIDMRQALERAGQLSMPSFTVEGQQERVMLRDRKGRKVISGKKDCAIRWESGARWSTEFKSWSAFLTDRVEVFTDLLKSPWTRGGAMQILAYLYAKEEAFGLFVLDRPGIPRLLPVSLEENIQLVEDFLVDAELGRDHIEAGTLPDHINDPSECRRCPVFGSYCQPNLSYAGVDMITDEEVLAQIERHELLDESRTDYAEIHEALKEFFKLRTPKTFKGKNKKQVIAGKFLVECGWGRNTTTELPDHEERIVSTDAGTVTLQRIPFKSRFQKTDDAGKFNFSIEQVDPTPKEE